MDTGIENRLSDNDSPLYFLLHDKGKYEIYVDKLHCFGNEITLTGYRMYLVEEFLFSKNYQQSTIIEYTGEENDKIQAYMLHTTKETSQRQILILKTNLNQNEKHFKIDDINGYLFSVCSNLNLFAQSHSLLSLPSDFKGWKNINLQYTLKQMGANLLIQQSVDESDLKEKFLQTYPHLNTNLSLKKILHSFITNIQRALYNLLYLDKEKGCNGKLFDVSGNTINAIKQFRNEEGNPQKKGEPFFNSNIFHLLLKKLDLLCGAVNSSQVATYVSDPFNEGSLFTNSLNSFLNHHNMKHESTFRHNLQKLVPENINRNKTNISSNLVIPVTNSPSLQSLRETNSATYSSYENKTKPHKVPPAVQNQIEKLDKKLAEQEKEIELYKNKFQTLSKEYTELFEQFKEKCQTISIFEERLEIYQKNYHKSEYKMAEMKDKIIQSQEILADYRQKVVELEGMTRQITNKSSLVKKIGIKVLETFVIIILKFVVFIGWIFKLFKIVSKQK